MGEILIAIGILGGLGVIFGAVLAAASKVFYVEIFRNIITLRLI